MNKLIVLTMAIATVAMAQNSGACCRFDLPSLPAPPPIIIPSIVVPPPVEIIQSVARTVDHTASEALNVASLGEVGRQRREKALSDERDARNKERQKQIDALTAQQSDFKIQRARKEGAEEEVQNEIIKNRRIISDNIEPSLTELRSIRSDFEETVGSTMALQMVIEQFQKAFAKQVSLNTAADQIAQQMKEKRYAQQDIKSAQSIGAYLSTLRSKDLVSQALAELADEVRNSKERLARVQLSKSFGNLKNSLENQKADLEQTASASEKVVATLVAQISALDQQITAITNRINELKAHME